MQFNPCKTKRRSKKARGVTSLLPSAAERTTAAGSFYPPQEGDTFPAHACARITGRRRILLPRRAGFYYPSKRRAIAYPAAAFRCPARRSRSTRRLLRSGEDVRPPRSACQAMWVVCSVFCYAFGQGESLYFAVNFLLWLIFPFQLIFFEVLFSFEKCRFLFHTRRIFGGVCKFRPACARVLCFLFEINLIFLLLLTTLQTNLFAIIQRILLLVDETSEPFLMN